MLMTFLPLLSLFAKPLGSIINKGIAAGAASVIGYSVAKGNPLGDVTPIVSMIALALSTAISGFAATQGVKIDVLNSDDTNGVKVVSAKSSSPAVSPIDASKLGSG